MAQVYTDFGDVFHTDFRSWWLEDKRGERLFAEPPAPMWLKELGDVSDWDSSWTRQSVMVVAVPLNDTRQHLKSKFAKLLARRHSGKAGVSVAEGSKALYCVQPNYQLPALEQMLMVYELRQKKPDLKLFELGQELKLVSTAMPAKGDTPKRAADKRNIMAASVSRYLSKAALVIRSAGTRRFPQLVVEDRVG